jgi:hypothetical protein
MKKIVKKINSLRSIASRVSANVSKEIKASLFVASMRNDDVLSALLVKCTKQNQVIDLCAKYQKSFDFCVNKLVELNLCKSTDHASKRVKRHKKIDIESAINSRLSNLK